MLMIASSCLPLSCIFYWFFFLHGNIKRGQLKSNYCTIKDSGLQTVPSTGPTCGLLVAQHGEVGDLSMGNLAYGFSSNMDSTFLGFCYSFSLSLSAYLLIQVQLSDSSLFSSFPTLSLIGICSLILLHVQSHPGLVCSTAIHTYIYPCVPLFLSLLILLSFLLALPHLTPPPSSPYSLSFVFPELFCLTSAQLSVEFAFLKFGNQTVHGMEHSLSDYRVELTTSALQVGINKCMFNQDPLDHEDVKSWWWLAREKNHVFELVLMYKTREE